MSWYDIDLTTVDTPALLIDKTKVEHNINLAIELAGGVSRLRPHVKTHKMLEVARMQMAAGLTRFKCATIPEAEMLGMAGAGDVLIAYQPQGPKVRRVKLLIEKYPDTTYSVLVDNVDSARAINSIFQDTNHSLQVYIDINDGHNRTGIKPPHVGALCDKVQELENLELAGLHCYDGHIRMPSFEERSNSGTEAFEDVTRLREIISNKTGKDLNVIAGGSPSFTVHAKYHEVECSPGTFIFWDQRYGTDYQEQRFEKAAVVATRVISKIDSNTYCLDLGHKSIASEFPFPRVAFITDFTLSQIGHSEEHLVVRSEETDCLNVGDLLIGYPYHICPTVALYDSAHIVADGEIIDNWKVIARDRKITI